MANIADFEDLVLDANEVVNFRLVRNTQDLEDDSLDFGPEMSHQIFGAQESIFGYRNLKVQLMYTAGPLNMHVNMTYDKNVAELSRGELKPDDVVGTIAKALPEGVHFEKYDEFVKQLKQAKTFRPFGEKLSEHDIVFGENETRSFEFYRCNSTSEQFLSYFARLQSFILWFVDAASYIDTDDPQWNYFLCYERSKNGDGEVQYTSVGYTTVYEYYAYPDKKRVRISQMLVLPPFQRAGVGAKFLETIYDFYRAQGKAIQDITVEGPSEEFQQLRNFVDVKLCMNLPCFKAKVIKQGFNKDMINETRTQLKINAQQCRRIYEILRLYHTDLNDELDYRSYRLAVKKRLNATYYKQILDLKRLETKYKMDVRLMREKLCSKEQRIKQLHEEYEELEKKYKATVEKLQDFF